MTIGRIPSVEGGIQPTIVDAKGDLIAATAADTVNRLAVGSNDQVLVADSSTSTGLAWKSYGAQFVAGKNKIINGDMFINQRNTTSTTTSTTFLVDRFRIFLAANAGSVTGSVQQFTPGSAPVSGYEAKQYLQVVTVGQAASTDRAMINYPGIEDVRTFAGQTMTVSFWAKAATGTPNVAVEVTQYFGTGGSPSASVVLIDKKAISSSWVRYSYTFNLGSLAGKTIGTDANSSFLGLNIWFSAGSTFDSRTNTLGLQNNTFDLWGVQVEAGSTATPFTTATGTIQGELAACQRYYQKSYPQGTAPAAGSAGGMVFGIGMANSATSTVSQGNNGNAFPVVMRTAPTITFYDNAGNSGKGMYNKAGGTTVNNVICEGVAQDRGISYAYTTGASGLTTGDAVEFAYHYVASAEL